MLNDNPVLKWTLVALLVLVVLPLIAMVAMMAMGAVSGGGMMSQMGGMMGGSGGMMMGGGMMALSFLWAVLVAAALVALIVLLVRGTTHA